MVASSIPTKAPRAIAVTIHGCRVDFISARNVSKPALGMHSGPAVESLAAEVRIANVRPPCASLKSQRVVVDILSVGSVWSVRSTDELVFAERTCGGGEGSGAVAARKLGTAHEED